MKYHISQKYHILNSVVIICHVYIFVPENVSFLTFTVKLAPVKEEFSRAHMTLRPMRTLWTELTKDDFPAPVGPYNRILRTSVLGLNSFTSCCIPLFSLRISRNNSVFLIWRQKSSTFSFISSNLTMITIHDLIAIYMIKHRFLLVRFSPRQCDFLKQEHK